ncbi:nuclear pore complex protein Nup93 [Exaiptasia diaphana]|uniref:Nuclear pore protein n=1 Tax=Exaiptasia diaphana TaxID=2652724 RepID=A0A913X755_EXADI|nr:nuclear pore complex protein Nup93 [Exaiptasia diaphana]KXJ26896.1 Nuclear pore complex protein Nup93 [Exaiptasia diaphana]
MSSTFGDLLQQAEQLTADMDTGGELPRIDLNLHQLAEAGTRLWSRTSGTVSDSADVKASILLGSKGFDVPKLSEKLEQLDTTKTFEPLEPVRETDIQGFLRNERENAILSAIEEARKNTFSQSERHQWNCMESEWEKEKEKILNSLLGAGQETLGFPSEPEVFSTSSLSMQGRSALDAMELAYARQVYIHNESVLQGRQHDIVLGFLEIADKMDNKNVVDVWEFIENLKELQNNTGHPQKLRSSPDFQIKFLEKARNFFEKRYKTYVQETVYDNLQQSRLGGIPGTLNLIRSFLKVKLPQTFQGLEDGDVDGTPVWPLIYFCMRCGDPQAAMQVMDYVPQYLGEFKEFFKEYIHNKERRLSPSTESKVRLQYRRSIRTSHDPFKRAVYCLIGHCDLADNHQEIATKTDDYLWLKLSLVSVNQDTSSQDEMTLSQLQSLLLEQFGEAHFGAYQQPFLYFQVLFLTGQFEAAIEFLSRVEFFRSHAVHYAISLYEMGLLATSESIQAQPLTIEAGDPPPGRRLNFARLIMTYTRKFEMTDSREALQYFYLLRGIKRPHGEDLFKSCISELVLETREFEMLLGSLQPDGSRKPGCIDKFQKNKNDTQRIIEIVAKDTEEKGLFEESIKLYDLAKNNEKAIEILNKLLSQVVSTSGGNQSPRDRLQNLAVTIADRYRLLGHNASQSRISTFFLLLDLMQFFDLYHANQLDTALDVMQKLKLVPFSSETVEERVAAFRQYNDEIRRCLPDVLLASMNILFAKYKTTKSTGQSPLIDRRRDDGGQERFREILRRQARALITFAGLIPYRMPGDTNARLVQMEVLMN